MLEHRQVHLANLASTRAFAARLALLLRPGDVVGLSGPLGSGKSEIARAVIRARAGAAIEVPSPSFTLLQDYPLQGITIRHLDLYRIEDPAELLEIGVTELGPEDALLVEWPERAADALPADRLEIRIREGALPEARVLDLVAGPAWADRLEQLAHG